MAIQTTTQSHGTDYRERELPAELKAIVFDVDGTFYHLEGIRKALWFYFLRRFWHQPIKMRQE